MRQRIKTVRVRSAVSEDVEAILWLEEICMKAYAEALWRNWHASATSQTLDISIHEMIVVSDKTVGCIASRLIPDALIFAKVYLKPEVRNQGIGGSVLRQLLNRAGGFDRPVRLRVLTNNPAVRFYMRHGFRIEQRTPEHFYMIQKKSPQNLENEP